MFADTLFESLGQCYLFFLAGVATLLWLAGRALKRSDPEGKVKQAGVDAALRWLEQLFKK